MSDLARILRQEWEARARSPHRDYYVAASSNPGDRDGWDRQAKIDADLALYYVDPTALLRMDLLEIGCGIGRLVPHVAPRVRSLTGIDISPSMLDAARAANARFANARFFATDGLTIPPEAKDREYDMAFAVAVFIHCPRSVCESLFRSAASVLRPDGGCLRGQVLADPDDDRGIDPASAANMEVIHDEIARIEVAVTPEQRSLIDGTHYTGHKFGFDELEGLLRDLPFRDVTVWRFDRFMIYFNAMR